LDDEDRGTWREILGHMGFWSCSEQSSNARLWCIGCEACDATHPCVLFMKEHANSV
jgi:hypothetical protein